MNQLFRARLAQLQDYFTDSAIAQGKLVSVLIQTEHRADLVGLSADAPSDADGARLR